ncbi:MAG: putative 5-nucleotidase [Blastococcus sp.]|nr:putative 5-nucleotidase [Blastococcus sp.]
MRRTRLSLVVALAASAAVAGLPASASAAPASVSAERVAADIPVQLLAMNDFHGRISDTTGTDATITNPDGSPSTVGGAANVASTVTETREAFVGEGGSESSSFFVGAGDLISASPFESSVFKDEPTIEVLNAMGLDVSSVGNHEFDRGTEELRRISGATDGTYSDDVTACEGVDPGVDGCFEDSTGEDFHGTEFPYLAANVLVKDTDKPALPPYQVFTVGGGKKLALIGVVTETTPTIVSAEGVQDVDFIDEADAVNRWVPVLRRQGIQAIGVLIHEGGANTSTTDAKSYNGCDELTGPIVDINNRIAPAVDLIVSAHTHMAYDCLLDDPAGQPRLVTQAGFYGRLISDIRLTIDGTTGDVERFCADYRAANVPVLRDNPDQDVAAIVQYWNAKAAPVGDVVVGSATARIGLAGGPNRATEQPLVDLLAQSQLEGLRPEAKFGDPVVAFMNPGGARTNIESGAVTYNELFTVQPFSNTVNAITLSGSEIRAVLEQQFQLDPDGAGPLTGGARNTQLLLGTSDNFHYDFDVHQPYGQRVDPASIRLDPDGTGPAPETVIVPTTEYRVVANGFLAAGGDSFTAFTGGSEQVTGPLDIDTLVAYFKAHSPVAPPVADHARPTSFTVPPAPAEGLEGSSPPPPAVADGTSGVNGPGTTGPNCDATASISDDTPNRGQRVTLTGTRFAKGEKVFAVLVQGPRTLGTATADAQGNVTISFVVPNNLKAGEFEVRLTGQKNGESASTSFTLRAR